MCIFLQFCARIFYKPIISDVERNGKTWQWHPSMKEEAVLMNATQHLKYIYMCMDNYHLSASNLTTAASNNCHCEL